MVIYCGVFTPCKDCNIETRSRDYAIVDEAVFSPCLAVPSRAEPSRTEPKRERVTHRIASPRCCQATAINTWMTQQLKAFSHMSDPRVYRRSQ
jgi:hypothetical protein